MRLATESLCVADSEFHFVRVDGEWQISFICDMEWVDFGDPYSDLSVALGERIGLLDIDHPLIIEEASEISNRPFFRGYQTARAIDYDRLSSLTVYSQLGVWCSIVDQVCRPEKRDYVKSKEPVLRELVEAVASKATGG